MPCTTRTINLLLLLLATGILVAGDPGSGSQLPAQMNRGKLVYLQHCVICHQSSGQGSPGVFPPLFRSDYLVGNTEGSILAVVEGLSGRIMVNGTNYDGVMPPVLLDDAKVADVLTYARNAFGNSAPAITPEEVRAVRAKSKFSTYEKLVKAHAYPPLPKPPEGARLREVVKLPDHGTRLATDGKALYMLTGGGDIWRIDVPSGKTNQVLRGKDYIDRRRGSPSAMGICFDSDRRLYISCNQRNERGVLVTNEVTIFRSSAISGERSPPRPEPWFQTAYPWGIGPFNHGVSHIAFGPDGLLYVSSGSRTDGSEPGTDPRYYSGGELTNTACLWRLNPRNSAFEIFAHGLRNAYGFCWTDRGELFATDNGPDADAPEELNFIQQGKHYGFPFQFSDWTNKPYAHTPDPPPGLTFARPVANEGPAAMPVRSEPLYTFHPHSSPAGIIYLGQEYGPWRDSFLVVRFGHLIKQPQDHGFDLLQMRLEKRGETFFARTTTLLAPLGRPLDLVLLNRKVYILEYSRQTDNKGEFGSLPGRILELSFSQ